MYEPWKIPDLTNEPMPRFFSYSRKKHQVWMSIPVNVIANKATAWQRTCRLGASLGIPFNAWRQRHRSGEWRYKTAPEEQIQKQMWAIGLGKGVTSLEIRERAGPVAVDFIEETWPSECSQTLGYFPHWPYYAATGDTPKLEDLQDLYRAQMAPIYAARDAAHTGTQ